MQLRKDVNTDTALIKTLVTSVNSSLSSTLQARWNNMIHLLVLTL